MRAIQEHRTYKNNLPMTVFAAGDMSFLAHWHAEVEFVYILEGTQQVGINQEIYTLEKGDLAICSSGDIHYYAGSGNNAGSGNYAGLGGKAKQIITIFKPEFIGYSGGWPQQLLFTTPIQRRALLAHDASAIAAMDRIEQLLSDILTEYKDEQLCYADSIKSKLLEVCVLAVRSFPVYQADSSHSFRQYNLERMQKALQFIEDNYNRRINLDELAHHANLSYFHFSRLFKNTVGMNFKEYVNKRRIQQAELLLSSNSLSVTQVAYECGFESTRSFYRAYKALKGKAPGRIKPFSG